MSIIKSEVDEVLYKCEKHEIPYEIIRYLDEKLADLYPEIILRQMRSEEGARKIFINC